MDATTLLDATRVVHFAGIALALGVASLADFTALRRVWRPIDHALLKQLLRFHGVIIGGLAVLWISGLAIAWQRVGLNPADLSPKLIAKFAIVTLLTANALVMDAIALPLLRANLGRRLGEIDLRHRLVLGAIGGLSSACWAGALALGGFTQLRDVGLNVLALGLAGLAATGVMAGMAAVAVAAPRISALGPTLADQPGSFALRR